MKFVSWILIVLAMNWSWGLAQREPPVSEQTHMGIQSDLKRIIAEYIQENLPNSQNLNFQKFWTESINENTVRASFTYSFDDSNEDIGQATVQIVGSAILTRKEETPQASVWLLDELTVSNSKVDYRDPLQLDNKSE